MLHWEGHDIGRLFKKIQTMPPRGGAVNVTDADRLDVLAYVLQLNGFPAGAAELPADPAALGAFAMIPETGPRPMRSGAFVSSIGCLAKSGSRWLLERAGEPLPAVMDKNPADAPASINQQSTGTLTFELLNAFPDPSPYVGHTVQVKGLLIRLAAGDRINVTTVEAIAPTCS